MWKRLILIFVLLSFANSNKVVSVEFFPSCYIADITIYTPKVNIDMNLNTYLQYSKIDDFELEVNFEKKDSSIKGYQSEYITSFTLNNSTNNEIKGYHFLIDTEDLFIPSVGLSLAYHYDDEAFSIVHSMYNSKLIDYKAFTFDFNNSEIHFGFVDNDIGFPYSGYCDIEKGYNTWGCNVTLFQYDTIELKINSYYVFHSGYFNIISSDEFFDFMTEKVFKEQMSQKLCQIMGEETDGEKKLICNEEAMSNFSNITMKIGSMTVTLTKEDIFSSGKNGSYESDFINNPYDATKGYPPCLIGHNFLKIMNRTTFDYHTKRVSFYSDRVKIEMQNSNNNKLIYIIYAIGILCFISTIMIVFTYFKHGINI